MTVSASINPRKYARLLAHVLPGVIETEDENKRMLAEVKWLMDKPRLSPEESRLFDLLVRLIDDFEERHYRLDAATPRGILLELMAARGVKPRDLWSVFGSKGTASDVINGKRGVSKANAKALAEHFHVSAELFI